MVNLCNCLFRHKRVERLALEREAAEASNRTVEGPDIGLRDQLWVALRRLPIRQRTVLILRHYEDQSDEQIAEVMRCSRSAVRSLVSHGVETLRTVIGGEER